MITTQRTALLVVLALAVTGCDAPSASVDPAYAQAITEWRAQRLERLQTPDGWLSLVGLHWLEPGDNRMGSDPAAQVFLDAPGIAPDVGTLTLGENGVTFHPSGNSDVFLDSESLRDSTHLSSDADPAGPDRLKIGRLSATIIRRADRWAVRVRDPQAPTRIGFEGIESFPIDPAYRVEARLERFPEPREVRFATAVGTEETTLCPGILRFTVGGEEQQLLPWVDQPGDRFLFIVFKDGTSGTSTYGAGRFLTAQLNEDGSAVLDFNKATTPPCGFTAYATCPLAPEGNTLTVPIRAGEQYRGH